MSCGYTCAVKKFIDLRSDTVTTPCDGMRRAMAAAEVGDDVYGEDPSVKKLECALAEMAEKDSALFFPSGTQSNLAALLSHCARGDEYIAAQNAHTYRYEGGGAAVLGGIQPQPLEAESDGTLDLQKVTRAVKAKDFHFARSKLLALENTTGGKVLPLAYLARAQEVARAHQLSLHLDGARVFNAACALQVALPEIAKHFDSVSICLSKGLGAPVGSLLCAHRELISRARRWRKICGGGMRQSGVLAAAGLFALQNNVTRLRDDHARAKHLAELLARIDGVEVQGGRAHTNMVFVKTAGAEALRAHAKNHGVLFSGTIVPGISRMVVHLHITDACIETAARIIGEFFAGGVKKSAA